MEGGRADVEIEIVMRCRRGEEVVVDMMMYCFQNPDLSRENERISRSAVDR